MRHPLSVLVALILVFFYQGNSWTAPDFCHQKQCPEFRVVSSNQDFEERSYVATDWITTKIESTSSADVVAANSKLKNYCNRQNDAGFELPLDTWPVLISVTKRKDSPPELFLSWFIPPGTKKPEDNDPSVKLESKPAATVYVRMFGGTPSIDNGESNANTLREALIKAEKTFSPDIYFGVGYESYFSLTHHNEVWIYAD